MTGLPNSRPIENVLSSNLNGIGFKSEKPENFNLENFWYTILIIDKNVCSTFPNILTLLRIYLALMITNCSGESFSLN